MHLGLASFTHYHELTQMDGFPLNIYFRWGHWNRIVLLWGRREGRQLYLEHRAFLTMLHIQGPGSAESNRTRETLWEGPYRQASASPHLSRDDFHQGTDSEREKEDSSFPLRPNNPKIQLLWAMQVLIILEFKVQVHIPMEKESLHSTNYLHTHFGMYTASC